MLDPRRVDRRDFLKTSGVGTAALAAGVWTSRATAESTSPNEKLNIACIGTANRAAADIAGLASQNIAVLCDVDQNYLDRAAQKFPQARTYADYREMIDQEGDRIDAVMVGTTDHHHALASLLAIRAGKHVYCEKPLTHTIAEARLLAAEAKKYGVATQMGTQMHATNNYRRVVEIVQAGLLGDVTEVHVWVGKSWGGGERPEGGKEPPAALSWDLWLGPAPERPFWPGRYHPAQWRRWWDFGNGTLGDMGCHFMDLPFWALKLRYPTRCVTEGPAPHAETAPLGLTAHYDFPAREGMPAVNLTWYDGNRIPRTVAGERVPGNGVMFVGSEAKLYANYSSYRVFPAEKAASFQPPEQTIPNSIGHYNEWIKACREGSPTTCNFDYSGALTESVLLGSVAYRVGKPIDWDGENLQVTNSPEADQYIRKQYRAGWEVAEDQVAVEA